MLFKANSMMMINSIMLRFVMPQIKRGETLTVYELKLFDVQVP